MVRSKISGSRLWPLLLENTNQLQILFKGLDVINPIQEQIWYHAKAYLKVNLNQNLDIPKRTNYAGRYVQYPKSQALLNTEDLKYFTSFFAQEFQVKENISLQYFETRLNRRFPYISKTSRANILWSQEEKRSNCVKQLYDFYNLWDGRIHTPLSKKPSQTN